MCTKTRGSAEADQGTLLDSMQDVKLGLVLVIGFLCGGDAGTAVGAVHLSTALFSRTSIVHELGLAAVGARAAVSTPQNGAHNGGVLRRDGSNKVEFALRTRGQ